MLRLIIIADDLTGALDSAAPFANRGASCIVARSPDDLTKALKHTPEILAISTGTREKTPQEAQQILAALASQLPEPKPLLLKKIDSRMKGPIGAELRGLLGADPTPLWVCPALPREGRFIRDGQLYGRGVTTPIPIADRIGLPCHIPEIDPDTADPAMLPPDLATSPLLVGASGLTSALVQRLYPTFDAPQTLSLPLPLIMAIGSRDPITLRQIAQIPLQPTLCPAGNCPDLSPAPVHLLQLSSDGSAHNPADLGAAFSRSVSAMIARHKPRSLFACGGETANGLLQQLGIGVLRLHHEIRPGIPGATALNVWPGLEIATKSGGFGNSDDLAQLIEQSLSISRPRL
ncbi:MAG: four-carbon acid sugar kinase family protein [Mangrovicoccus sp.]